MAATSRRASTSSASNPTCSPSRAGSSSFADPSRSDRDLCVALEVQLWRGAIPESRHRLQAAVCDSAGHVVFATESPHLVTTLRSAAKPFQLLSLVERGHADALGFGSEELAVMAASHTGSARHTALVRRILERIGCSVADLACGAEK